MDTMATKAVFLERLYEGGEEVVASPSLSLQKQAEHVKGTPQYQNRIRQGKPTSAFDNAQSAEQYTREAWQRGTSVLGRPNVREYDFGRQVGTGPKGGAQTRVRVHQDARGRIHGHPSGPEETPEGES